MLDDTNAHCTFNYTMSAFIEQIAASTKVGAVPNLFTTVMAALALGPGVLRSEDAGTVCQPVRQL